MSTETDKKKENAEHRDRMKMLKRLLPEWGDLDGRATSLLATAVTRKGEKFITVKEAVEVISPGTADQWEGEAGKKLFKVTDKAITQLSTNGYLSPSFHEQTGWTDELEIRLTPAVEYLLSDLVKQVDQKMAKRNVQKTELAP